MIDDDKSDASGEVTREQGGAGKCTQRKEYCQAKEKHQEKETTKESQCYQCWSCQWNCIPLVRKQIVCVLVLPSLVATSSAPALALVDVGGGGGGGWCQYFLQLKE
eukprot:7050898-Ditylum_brightwellii.AAC.1